MQAKIPFCQYFLEWTGPGCLGGSDGGCQPRVHCNYACRDACMARSEWCEWLTDGGSPTHKPGCFKKFSIRIVWHSLLFIPRILQVAVSQAIQRWRKVLLGQPGFGMVVTDTDICGGLYTLKAGFRIEDMLVVIDYRSIDGPGKAVAGSIPCVLWQTGATAVAYLRVDMDDVSTWTKRKLSPALLNSVITHEFGHCLGFGSLWIIPTSFVDSTGVSNRNLLTSDFSHYTGAGGIYGLSLLRNGGGGMPQVETQYGVGSAKVHWSESVYGDELMTPVLNIHGPMPLSAMTAYSIGDLGYVLRPYVQYEPYQVPTKATTVAPSSTNGGFTGLHAAVTESGLFAPNEMMYELIVMQRSGLDVG